MKALILTVGSRGDAEPFCALAEALISSSACEGVEIFLQPDMRHLASPPCSAGSHKLKVHEWPFTQADFYQFVANPSHGADSPNPRIRFVGIVADVIGELVLPCLDAVQEVAAKSTVIVTSSIARPLALALCQKFNLPCYAVFLQPIAPTTLFPHYSLTEECVKVILDLKANGEQQELLNGSAVESKENGEAFLRSYFDLEKAQHDFLCKRLEPIYKRLDIPSIEFEASLWESLQGQSENVFIVNAFSSQVIPGPEYTSSLSNKNVMNVGALADSLIPKDWTPPDSLSKFLGEKDKKPPVCVGFGSMPFDMAPMVVEALCQLEERAVLVGDAFKDVANHSDWANENLFFVSSVPYAWLLHRCSMMVCHGGAGVVHACLRAGIPSIISPLMGDQFFWGDLLQALGLGMRIKSNLTNLSSDDLKDAISNARHCIPAAKSMGVSIQNCPSGAETLAEILVK